MEVTAAGDQPQSIIVGDDAVEEVTKKLENVEVTEVPTIMLVLFLLISSLEVIETSRYKLVRTDELGSDILVFFKTMTRPKTATH